MFRKKHFRLTKIMVWIIHFMLFCGKSFTHESIANNHIVNNFNVLDL